MKTGISKYWTPEFEENYAEILTGCSTFAERHLTMLLRDLLKYDARSKEGKIAVIQSRLRLATATDTEFEEIVALERAMAKKDQLPFPLSSIDDYKKLRDKVINSGIKRSELGCQ